MMRLPRIPPQLLVCLCYYYKPGRSYVKHLLEVQLWRKGSQRYRSTLECRDLSRVRSQFIIDDLRPRPHLKPVCPSTDRGGDMPEQYSSAPEMSIDPSKTYTASIRTTKGTMTLELFAGEAPVTVNNFVFLAREGYYSNGVFHRVIKGFMIQGGCPRGDGTGGPGYRFADETVTRQYTKGTLAMANSGPNTNGSQFFIVHGDNAGLPPNYTIFGMLSDGQEALDALADSPVGGGAGGERSRPTERLEIQSIEISES